MKKNQIDIITMGCSKNLVDSEQLMRLFEANGFVCKHDAPRPQGEIAVINTCGFIESAKEESINTILEFVERKNAGRLRKLYVMGCLSQRYQKELEAELPEVDKFYGKFNYKQLLQDLLSEEGLEERGERKEERGRRKEEGGKKNEERGERREERGERNVSSLNSSIGNSSRTSANNGGQQGCSLSPLPSPLSPTNVSSLNSSIGNSTRTSANDGGQQGCSLSPLPSPLSPTNAPAPLQRTLTTPSHYAYVKIAEGCDRHCAYCAIPLITGKHVSRPQDEILDEVRALVGQGVKEFQVIEQELTYYGVDLDGRRQIAELVSRMADIEGVEWLRLHYAYPNQFPLELLDVIRERTNVCSYLDIALQHISDHMLTRMHRHVSKQQTLDLIREIRRRVPGLTLRTTLMVGFPGETDEDFRELMDFVRETRFERMGAFAYSEEEGTYSAEHYEDDVPPEVKQRRLDQLMALQQQISEEVEAAKVGSRMRVIIDRKEGDYYIARSEACSPEVDPEVLIPTAEKRLRIGQFYEVTITDSEEFDLYASVLPQKH